MNANRKDIEPERMSSRDLRQTIITPHMEERISPGKNLIYCSSFQIAWNEMQDSLIKEEIRLSGSLLMAQLLNKQLSKKSDLSEDCYVAMAEKLTAEFVQRINAVLKEKFGDERPPEVRIDIPPSPPMLLAYAYLYKNLQFAVKFQSLPEPIGFRSDGGTTKVRAFGIEEWDVGEEHASLLEQVSIIDAPSHPLFTRRNDLIVGLRSKSADDEIILAKIKPQDSLARTLETVMKRVEDSTPSAIQGGETLRIPKLDFKLNHSFEQLTNLHFENEGWKEWYIGEALQWIRFRLNEKGAVLKSEARVMTPTGLPMVYSFNEAFLIYLKRKDGKYPYFAVWVDNAELLLKE